MVAIIPARYSSVRLPGKLLLPIAGEPLIVHTMRRAAAARNVGRVIVATDDARIFEAVNAAGGEALMTLPEHPSGSDRIAEAAIDLPEGTAVVNIQGDEPVIAPETIERAVDAFLTGGADIVTVSEPFENAADILSPDAVKVVTNAAGFAMYFSRSPVPFPRDAVKMYGGLGEALSAEPELIKEYRKHTGIYVYGREFLIEYTKKTQSRLEKFEMLEQMRALEEGSKIRVVKSAAASIGVDTQEDLDRVRAMFETERAGV